MTRIIRLFDLARSRGDRAAMSILMSRHAWLAALLVSGVR